MFSDLEKGESNCSAGDNANVGVAKVHHHLEAALWEIILYSKSDIGREPKKNKYSYA